MIALGGTNIVKAYLGQTELANIAIGDELLLSSEPTPLPYDAEVEYLESSGTQYIDTGLQYNYSNNVIVEQRATVAFTVTNERQLNGSNGFGYWGITSGNKFECAGGKSTKSAGTTQHTVSFVYKNENGTPYSTFYVDETKLRDGTCVGTLNNYQYDIFIFAIGGRGAAAALLFSKEKIYSYQILFDNVLVRDYIPVRVGQVGCMYDKVSKTLFGNAGTGNFVLGNDIT